MVKRECLMMHSQLTIGRKQLVEIDRRAVEQYGMSSLVLMENAGRGAAELLLRLGARGPICVCCGKGNNGGDGFVIARHLEAAGLNVSILMIGDPAALTRDAASNFQIIAAAGTPWTRIDSSHSEGRATLDTAEWIVDALLGTGAQGEVRSPYADMIEQINEAAASVLAVDLPSGLDCDTGRPLGPCIRARQTATFVARKRGFDHPEAASFTGVVTVLPIGVPRQLLAAYNL
jgi:NAD(P)H-hydrate epimerase